MVASEMERQGVAGGGYENDGAGMTNDELEEQLGVIGECVTRTYFMVRRITCLVYGIPNED